MDLRASVERDRVAPSSFDEFFRAYFAKVVRAAALVTGDATGGQDHAQEAFLRLYARWGAMQSEDHARNFVFKVAINSARSFRRSRLRLVQAGLPRAEPSAPGTGGISADEWLEVTAALAVLPMRQRACVVMVDYADMDSEAAARALRISPSTVRVHLMRGRQALRARLGLVPAKDEER